MSLKYYPDHIYIENLMEKQEQHIVGNQQYIGNQSNYPQDKITPPPISCKVLIYNYLYMQQEPRSRISQKVFRMKSHSRAQPVRMPPRE